MLVVFHSLVFSGKDFWWTEQSTYLQFSQVQHAGIENLEYTSLSRYMLRYFELIFCSLFTINAIGTQEFCLKTVYQILSAFPLAYLYILSWLQCHIIDYFQIFFISLTLVHNQKIVIS